MPTVGAQPQQLCDKTHTHFNWNGVNKIKTKKTKKKQCKKSERGNIFAEKMLVRLKS